MFSNHPVLLLAEFRKSSDAGETFTQYVKLPISWQATRFRTHCLLHHTHRSYADISKALIQCNEITMLSVSCNVITEAKQDLSFDPPKNEKLKQGLVDALYVGCSKQISLHIYTK
jgi:hypothetical protein